MKDKHWNWKPWQTKVRRSLNCLRIYLCYYVHKKTIFSAIRAGISGIIYEQNLAEKESSSDLSLTLWTDLGNDFNPYTALYAACNKHKMDHPILGKLPWPHGSLAMLPGYVPVFLLLNHWNSGCLCCSLYFLNLCPSGFLLGMRADTYNLSWDRRMAASDHLGYIVRRSSTPTPLLDVINTIWWWFLLDVLNWFNDVLLSTCLFCLAICSCTFAWSRLNKLIHLSHEYSYYRSYLWTI